MTKSFWIISTGDYSARVQHEENMSATQALVKALKKRAPKNLGFLVECRLKGCEPVYVSSVKALELAGYKIDLLED